MSELPRVPGDSPVVDVLAALHEHGGVIVEDMIAPEVVARINADLDPYVEAADPAAKHINPGLDAFFGTRTREVTSITGKSSTFATEVLCHPTMLGVCDDILLPSCARYHLNIASILDRGPGAEAQMLHHDEDVWIHVPRPRPELQVASIWALVDITREMGATQVVPGSHRWNPRHPPHEDEIAYAEMRAGSAVVYLGSTQHGGGANTTTDRWRRAVHLSYTLGWLRTEENNYLGTPPHIARTLPRQAQELVGYAVHDAIESFGGYLGILDGRDPVDCLADGSLT